MFAAPKLEESPESRVKSPEENEEEDGSKGTENTKD
jgi:hypothetical protein